MAEALRYPRRLIEVDLPIRRISEHARNEKESRRAHIPRLHIYPAARPMAACRAVLCAALWPDPADDGCPGSFRDKARAEMMAWTPLERQRILSPESRIRFDKARRSPEVFGDNRQLRGALLDFIADFANWDNATVPEYLNTSRVLTQVAHEALSGRGTASKPLVFDPFAGGGAIPLEALRIGADAFASDLNPLAVLIERVVLEHIPEFGERLAEELRRFEGWVKPRAAEELGQLFPLDNTGATPIAYLWARTILSEAPSTGEYPIEVPLIRSMWLTRGKDERNWALRWVTDKTGRPKTQITDLTFADGSQAKVRRLVLETIRPSRPEDVPPGTIRGGSVVCPVTGFTTPVKRVRAQLSKRHGGTNDARMYCVVMPSQNGEGRSFRIPSRTDHEAADSADRELRRRYSADEIPFELLPAAANGFRVQNYGIRTWGDLFTPRQTLALLTYAKLVREYVSGLPPEDERFKTALESVLALLVNRLADLDASLCGWQLNTPNTAHVFVRWVLPMVFDFGEVNPLAAAGGSPESALRRIQACIDDLVPAQLSMGNVSQHPAIALPLADDMADAFVTDPPYYDAIPYSDLLDFFVVWMKRVCRHQTFELEQGLSPKGEECVVDGAKAKDHAFFERTMTASMAEARRVLAPHGIGVVVFAHKTTSGWEAQLEGLIRAGFSVTASWPIDTEMGSRMRAQRSAALASSVHLVCRPRENPDGSLRASETGDWREVLRELPRRLHEWMPRLADEGVVGADSIFACIGPALEIFSRHARVERATGEVVTLREYLEQVWAAVSREALSMIFVDPDTAGLDEDARLTAMWLWTIAAPTGDSSGTGADSDDTGASDEEDDGATTQSAGAGFTLEFDAARKIAQGLGAQLEALAHVVEVKGDKARLRGVGERTKYLFGGADEAPARKKASKRKPQRALFEELEEVAEQQGWGEVGTPRAGSTTLDRVHQTMILFGAGRGEALKRFLVDEGVGRGAQFWKLAQALSALYPTGTDEKRWVDGVLARKKGLGF